MRHKKLVLLEKGELVVLRDNSGNEVSFSSLADFTKYTGITITNKWYIGYEPDSDFFEDSEDASVSNAMIPYAPYENIIANIPLYKSRVADPYYGMTQEEEDTAIEEENRKTDIIDARTASGLAIITVAQAEAYIAAELDTTALDATGTAVNNATTLDELKTATLTSLIEMRNVVIKTRGVLLKMTPYLLS